MVKEIQAVYRLQGVKVDNKHVEVIMRQMLQKSEVVNPCEATLLAGDQIDKKELQELNEKTIEQGYWPINATNYFNIDIKVNLC